jgi:hypothetical protein
LISYNAYQVTFETSLRSAYSDWTNHVDGPGHSQVICKLTKCGSPELSRPSQAYRSQDV